MGKELSVQYISCLNGLPTSELSNISQLGEELDLQSRLLASERIDEELDAWQDAVVMYSELSSAMYDIIPKKEMMQFDKKFFATASHVHPEYSWLKVWPDFGPNGKDKTAEVSVELATLHFKSDGVQNDVAICLPKISLDVDSPHPKHLVGELMFVAAKSYEDLKTQVGEIEDINAEDFSGWVYPDGKTYYTKRFEFAEAKAAFGASPTGSEFTVPDIAGFLKPTCSDDGQLLQKQPGKNGVPEHIHAGVAMSDGASSKAVVKSKAINIPNGRATSCGAVLPFVPEYPGKFGVICAWPKQMFGSEDAYSRSLPAAKPNGYREISTGDRAENIIKIKYDDVSFKNSVKDQKVVISELKMDEAGTEYDENDESGTMSWPEHTFVPVLVYIGFPYSSKYTYWGDAR